MRDLRRKPHDHLRQHIFTYDTKSIFIQVSEKYRLFMKQEQVQLTLRNIITMFHLQMGKTLWSIPIPYKSWQFIRNVSNLKYLLICYYWLLMWFHFIRLISATIYSLTVEPCARHLAIIYLSVFSYGVQINRYSGLWKFKRFLIKHLQRGNAIPYNVHVIHTVTLKSDIFMYRWIDSSQF